MTERKYFDVTLSEHNNLPDELLNQLSIDEVEFNIGYIINSMGDIASIDRIMIEYFNRHQVLLDRIKLNAKLFRMARKGMLEPVPKTKGVYKVTKEFKGN